MERLIGTALGQAGDFAGAAAWRRAWALLGGGVRVAVAGCDAAVVRRVARALPDGVFAAPLPIAPGEADAAVDALLGAHAILWVTAARAPLPATEREVLAALAEAAPAARAVVVGDADLLPRVSDEPVAEAAAVLERVRALSAGWPVADDPGAWAAARAAERVALTRSRRAAVGRLLLDAARTATDLQALDLRRALAEHRARLDAAERDLDATRARARRAAAAVHGAATRETARLRAEWSAFLYELEAALPREIAEVPDLAVLRDALPRWLAHVVDAWLDARLAAWAAAVRADLDELPVDDVFLAAAALAPPGVHPGPVRADPGWGRRVAATAGVAAGAGLLLTGWWTPGLAALGAGVIVGSWPGRDRDRRTRAALTAAAAAALRAVGAEATRALDAQEAALAARLDALADEALAGPRAARDALAEALAAAVHAHEARLREVLVARAALDERLAALAEAG